MSKDSPPSIGALGGVGWANNLMPENISNTSSKEKILKYL